MVWCRRRSGVALSRGLPPILGPHPDSDWTGHFHGTTPRLASTRYILIGLVVVALGALIWVLAAGRGESTDGFHEIRGRYEPGPGGTARFRVESALRKDGGHVLLDLVFDLGQITRADATREAA